MYDALTPLGETLKAEQAAVGVDFPVNLGIEAAGLVESWVNGSSWRELCKETSLDQGDICRVLRRTLEVLKQIPNAYGVPLRVGQLALGAAARMDRFPVSDNTEEAPLLPTADTEITGGPSGMTAGTKAEVGFEFAGRTSGGGGGAISLDGDVADAEADGMDEISRDSADLNISTRFEDAEADGMDEIGRDSADLNISTRFEDAEADGMDEIGRDSADLNISTRFEDAEADGMDEIGRDSADLNISTRFEDDEDDDNDSYGDGVAGDVGDKDDDGSSQELIEYDDDDDNDVDDSLLKLLFDDQEDEDEGKASKRSPASAPASDESLPGDDDDDEVTILNELEKGGNKAPHPGRKSHGDKRGDDYGGGDDDDADIDYILRGND